MPVLKRKTKRDPSLGERVAELRRERGLTQIEFAGMLGIDQSLLSNYERGKIRLHGELIAQMARVLRVSADEILGLDASRPGKPMGAGHRRLRRLLAKIDQLSARERQTLFQVLDGLLSRREKPA